MKTLRRVSLCFYLLSICAGAARGLNPDWQISQYAHTAWRTRDGAFGGQPISMAQTADGYLWIGTGVGLVRFDGVRFVAWEPPAGTRLPDTRIYSLAAARDGGLWIGTGNGLAFWKDSALVTYPSPGGRIESLVEDEKGAAWLVRSQATDKLGTLCRVQGEQVQCYPASAGMPFEYAEQIARSSSGEFWIGSSFGLCRWTPQSSQIYFPPSTWKSTGVGAVKAVASALDGSTWAVIEEPGNGLHLNHFEHGVWKEESYPALGFGNAEVLAMFVDDRNDLWVGTAHSGIFRIQQGKVDHFGMAEGLSSDAVGSFFQDAEGSLWVVTSEGIDSFRDLHVRTYSMREGLSAAGASSLYAGRDGTVWVGNFQALDFLRGGALSAIREGQGLPGRNVTTLLEDQAGRLWLGIDNGLWVYDHGVFRAVRHADGTSLGIVFAIAEDVHHAIWVRAGPNLDRIENAELREETTSAEISSAYILAADPQGGVLLGRVNGELFRYDSGTTTVFPGPEGKRLRQIRDLLVEPDGSVWGTNLDGLIRWKDGQRHELTVENGLPCDGVFALVQDQRGNLWLPSRCGTMVLDRSQLEAWWADPEHARLQPGLVDIFDGMQPGLTSLKPQAVRSPDGRLWFVNGRVLQEIDPEKMGHNGLPPPVHLEGITANHASYTPEEGLQLPPMVRDLQIDYTALSFVAPEKVRFRFQLEGHDAGWQEAGTRRQAFYTNLPPGSYRFRVLACNNDGVWNESGAALSFAIAPAWYQTRSFLLLSGGVLLLLLWGLYQLRIRQLAAAMGARLDERLGERTRLARELHDTLLQTIQASKMVADDALDESAGPERMRHALKLLSTWLAQAVGEGREALNALRNSTTQRNDLGQGLQRATEDAAIRGAMQVEFSVHGEAREMHPIVRDEVYRIGYEAIRNAGAHSKGSRLEVELSYAQDLSLRVSDNGRGIDPNASTKGRFGLVGMRERAERIGGRLTLSSSAGGTEVTLIVPGRLIFRGPDEKGAWGWLTSRLRRLAQASGPE